jgi:hypothetical protein
MIDRVRRRPLPLVVAAGMAWEADALPTELRPQVA